MVNGEQGQLLSMSHSACSRFPAWRQPRGYYGYVCLKYTDK